MLPNSRYGFTLIELLVAISIIGLLSSVVLSTVQNVKVKAFQSTNSQLAEQYRTALEMYFEDQGQYPHISLNATYCLGDYSDNLCAVGNSTSENATINTQLAGYIGGAPTGQSVVWDVIPPGLTFEGPLYTCNAIVGGKCIWATVSQLIKGNSRQLCANACSVYSWGGDYWMCNYAFGSFSPAGCTRED